MKNLLTAIILFSTLLSASARGDVKVIEASENIKLFGQRMVKDYLFYYKNPKKTALKTRLNQDIGMLEKSIIEIATITKNKNSKNVLDFLAYNKDEIKILLNKKVDREKSILMLDYGETFLEGANSIFKEHSYEFSGEEKMLMIFKDLEYLIERISKYYVASALNLDKSNNIKNMNESIAHVEVILIDMNHYCYPNNIYQEVRKINKVWGRYKHFLSEFNALTVPNLMHSSEGILEKAIKKIALYHKQNQ